MPIPVSPTARLFYRVAKQRFEDAEFLLEVKRTTAAVYLAGYSVECMLKAMVLAGVPQTQERTIAGMFRGARAHDYGWLLQLYSDQGGPRVPRQLVPHFVRVNTWSTEMRYSPGTVELREAKAFLDAAIEIINWADGRV